jgi:hypothetical protein
MATVIRNVIQVDEAQERDGFAFLSIRRPAPG